MVFFTAETSRMETVMSNKESGMYTFDETIVSDLHKDAYGFRPSAYWWQVWSESTDDQKQGTWDDLLDMASHSIERERQAHVRAIEKFEQLVAKTIEHGAGDRETALRWIMDASICDGDWEFLCHEHGLPYGFFNKREAA